jgi:N-acetylglucosamine-6-phosphate deacetylase
VIVQIILDGVHLAEETARVVWQSAAGRVALVTDAVAGAGMADGAYFLAGSEIEVRDGVVRGNGDILAGSALAMIEAVRNLHGLGIPLTEAVAAATAVPARVLGEPSLGRLDVDLPADLVILDDNLEIERVCVRGEARVVA